MDLREIFFQGLGENTSALKNTVPGLKKYQLAFFFLLNYETGLCLIVNHKAVAQIHSLISINSLLTPRDSFKLSSDVLSMKQK